MTAWKSTNGTYLHGSLLESFYVQTLNECLQHCARRCPSCGSVNAAVAGRTTVGGGQLNGWWLCELNGLFDNSSMLTVEEGWEFYPVDITRCH